MVQQTDSQSKRRLEPTVTGWSAAAFLAFVGAIAGLATWATSDASAERLIGSEAGLTVAVGMAALFLVAALGPSWQRSVPSLGKGLEKVGVAFEPLGAFLSGIDQVLVERVAPLAGATLDAAWKRYSVLALHLGGSTALALYFQSHANQLWPFQTRYTIAEWATYFPLVWGFLVSFSISRRWAWIEQDRETAMITSVYETGQHSSLRIGFAQDLRDEAMLSFMFIFLFVPIALAQVSHYGVFRYPDTLHPTYWDWLGFFGAELAKAVPFVDWAEVYNVRSGSQIVALPGMGQHVVFTTRVMIDLILLAALLQAMQISGRIEAQRREFQAGRLPRLDPFLERAEFARLAAGDPFSPTLNLLTPTFPTYDGGRLHYLARDGSSARLRAVALRLLCELKAVGFFDILQERLVGDRSDQVQGLAAELIANSSDDRRFGALSRGILANNYVRNAHTKGVQLVELIAKLDPGGAIGALVTVLEQAGHREVRLAALKSLAHMNTADPQNARVKAVAECLRRPDPSREVRRQAVTTLKMLGVRSYAVVALGGALNGTDGHARDPDQSVRRRAVEALKSLGGEQARAALERAKDSESGPIQAAAAEALDQLPAI